MSLNMFPHDAYALSSIYLLTCMSLSLSTRNAHEDVLSSLHRKWSTHVAELNIKWLVEHQWRVIMDITGDCPQELSNLVSIRVVLDWTKSHIWWSSRQLFNRKEVRERIFYELSTHELDATILKLVVRVSRNRVMEGHSSKHQLLGLVYLLSLYNPHCNGIIPSCLRYLREVSQPQNSRMWLVCEITHVFLHKLICNQWHSSMGHLGGWRTMGRQDSAHRFCWCILPYLLLRRISLWEGHHRIQ